MARMCKGPSLYESKESMESMYNFISVTGIYKKYCKEKIAINGKIVSMHGNMSQRFKVRDKLLKILKMVGASEKLFTTEQVKNYLGKYIDDKNLYDPKMRVVVCKGDLLEDVFGVQQLTISNYKDFWQFVFPYLIPATNREVQEHESECKNKQNYPQESDNTNGKMDLKWMSQLPWWYFVQKDKEDNMDKATASDSIVANTTIDAVDTEYDTGTEESHSVDLGYADRFSEEYEPDSEDSFASDDTEPFSPVDKQDLQMMFRPSVVLPEDNETMTTTTDTTDVSMEYDIPIEDQWVCEECSTVNLPTFGYCERCWKLRKGWLPETSLPSPGLRKSFTLPSSQKLKEDKFEYPETSSIPKLGRSSSQPNPIITGIDVTDGCLKLSKNAKSPTQHEQTKNESLNTSPHAASSSTSNFNNLPFNQLKRKHSTLSETYFPASKISNDNSDDVGSANIRNNKLQEIETPKKLTKTSTVLKHNLKSDSTCSQAGSSDHSTENVSSSDRAQCFFSTPGICNICHSNPNDATIIHGDFGHQYCCYRCAKKLKKRGRTCPVCRQPIALVVRNFICQM